VLAVESIQDDIQAIAWRLGALRDNLMAIMIDLLATYAEHCNETYEGMGCHSLAKHAPAFFA
jgi:hypothetical protein